MQNALIILAGGSGQRLIKSTKIPKQYIKIGSTNIIEFFLDNLDIKIFDIIVIVCNYKMKNKYLSNLKKNFFWLNIKFAQSGKNRQDSSKRGIYSFVRYNPSKILIHDAARPIVSNKLIKKLIISLSKSHVCVPFVKHNDLVNTILYSLKEYDDKSDVDFMDVCVFEASDYKK